MNNEKKIIVIKVGTSSLTAPGGDISEEKIENIVRQAAALKDKGHGVVIVTSGSIAAGFKKLGFKQRPRSIPEKQASAAAGQGLLMEEYTKKLWERGYVGAQILLTRGDFVDRRRYDNVFNAINVLLSRGAVPIINENDTTSIEELKVGDNDTLSAQVAAMIHADLLLLLTDMDGLYTADPRKNPDAEHIPYVTQVTSGIEALAGGAASELSTGGMHTKITAAALATMAGVPVFICSSKDQDSILLGAEGKVKGTYFEAHKDHLKTRIQWMAFYTVGKGRLYVDSGAANALKNLGKSLLPSGIVAIEGEFFKGDVVDVYSSENEFLGRGICGYDKGDLMKLKGLPADREKKQAVAIHRDNWVSSDKIRLIKD